jgi:cytochrome c
MKLHVLLLACIAALLIAGCSRYANPKGVYAEASRLTGGDPHTGPQRINHYGCGGCHTIPGIQGAKGLVGPPLTRIRSRTYLAGELPNTPDNLIRWIRQPHSVEPHTAMPDMGVTEQDARDIAAYLYTLH